MTLPEHSIRDELIAFFKTNIIDEAARSIRYPNFPQYLTLDNRNKKWNRRKYGAQSEVQSNRIISRTPVIGMGPHQYELYCLRSFFTAFHDLQGEEVRTEWCYPW